YPAAAAGPAGGFSPRTPNAPLRDALPALPRGRTAQARGIPVAARHRAGRPSHHDPVDLVQPGVHNVYRIMETDAPRIAAGPVGVAGRGGSVAVVGHVGHA
ncbi:hypothetical protein, partial [Dactylosporangium sp. NPDC050588]|uniref:hypothetical protein n=1 Tax=Dactylosporangium sp. NPDC050588 TaxID=3157211 RepID=UPI00340D3C87